MQTYFNWYRGQDGNAVAGAQVSVYNANSSTLATIYEPTPDGNPTLTKANPFTTDATGFYQFAAPNGDYSLVLGGGGAGTVTIQSLNIWDGGASTGGPMTNPMTALGSVIYGGATPAGTPNELPPNTSTTPKYLREVGTGLAGQAPTWAQPAASEVSNTPAGSIGSTNVQAAINELDGDIAALTATVAANDAAALHKAGTENVSGVKNFTAQPTGIIGSSIGNTPAGNVAATNVQSAINELDSEKVALADLANTSTVGLGDALVGVKSVLTGGTARTQHTKNADVVDARDFGVVADGTTDDTTALQAAIDACGSNTATSARELRLPPGNIKITSPLTFKFQYHIIRGQGMWTTVINFGAAAAAFNCSAMTYLRPILSDFQVNSASGTGLGFDLSNISGQVYGGSFTNIVIYSVGQCIYAPNFFSMAMINVWGASTNDHTFRVNCGPGVSWISCYALQTGSGKAGYRLAGGINMFGCNGVNTGDWWAIFGCDKAAADGYQNDFAANDYPDINCVGCNAEQYASISTNGGAVMSHNAFRSFNWIGGKFDRNNLSTGYKAIVQTRVGSNATGNPVNLSPAIVFKGTGTPSLAYLYSDVTGGYFYDESGAFTLAGITTWKVASSGLIYPVMTRTVNGDVFNDNAWAMNAVWPRRLTLSMSRYNTTTLTPVGAGQNIVVTGYNKVLVTPAAAASITTATFSATPGTSDDYLRNGELIIEATNANLTVNHSAAGANTFKMAAGANLAMTAGQVIRFLRSETNNNWVQV